MFASVTITQGGGEDTAGLAAMVGETMIAWMREIDGFLALLMLTQEDGRSLVVSLWESRELAELHRDARMRFRDRVTQTIDVRVEATDGFDVHYAWLRPGFQPGGASDEGERPFAAVTQATRKLDTDMANEAVMVGEAMVQWLSEIDGFQGFLLLTDDKSRAVQVIALWDRAETAERHRAARGRLRERISATAGVELGGTAGYDVPYAWFAGPAGD